MTSPAEFSKGPPEFPGFTVASVWRQFKITRPVEVRILRLSPDNIPLPKGEYSHVRGLSSTKKKCAGISPEGAHHLPTTRAAKLNPQQKKKHNRQYASDTVLGLQNFPVLSTYNRRSGLCLYIPRTDFQSRK